jgi:hypothetical protein
MEGFEELLIGKVQNHNYSVLPLDNGRFRISVEGGPEAIGPLSVAESRHELQKYDDIMSLTQTEDFCRRGGGSPGSQALCQADYERRARRQEELKRQGITKPEDVK